MERLVKGDVVVVPFPFTDLSASKKRPALVVATFEGEDLILAMISSQAKMDEYSIIVMDDDFGTGGLPLISLVRANRLTTADKSIVLRKLGTLKQEKLKEVQEKIIQIFQE
jgi:mRNA interferase MazF